MRIPNITAILAVTCSLLASNPAGAKLSAEEKEQASALYKQFTALKTDLPARGRVVDEMLAMGSDVGAVIHPIIRREFEAALERYQGGFATQTKSTARERNSREARGRIKELRQQIQALRSIRDLSKDQIVKVGDPALLELRKLTAITREEVLSSSEALAKARSDLLELGKQYNACIDALLLVEPDPFDAGGLDELESEVASTALSEDRDARKILEMNAKLASEIEPEEAEAIRDLNELRMLVGLRPCLIDPALCSAARGHSEDMQEHKFFDHTSPLPGKKSPSDRARLAGTSGGAENIFMGSKSGKSANRGWWHSPGHHKNMLSPGQRRVGMGSAGSYWTQMFGG